MDYNARATVGERFDEEMQAYRLASDRCRQHLSHADIVYDPDSGQTVDIFGAGSLEEPRPVFLFIHGGYWKSLSKHDSAMMAGMLAKHRIATAVVDYQLTPEVSLSKIVHQVRTSLAFLHRAGASFGLDVGRIHIGGSSAGGHLVGACLACGWHGKYGVPLDVVKSAAPISGLFELAPIAAGFPQQWLSLTCDEVSALSPIRHLPSTGCPTLIAWAENEASGFKRQSGAFAQAWSDIGNVTTLEVPGRNHFNVLLDLSNETSELSKKLLDMIG